MATKEITVYDVCGEEVEEDRYYMDEDFSIRVGDLDVLVYAGIIEGDYYERVSSNSSS
jgi:hypothetical protein